VLIACLHKQTVHINLKYSRIICREEIKDDKSVHDDTQYISESRFEKLRTTTMQTWIKFIDPMTTDKITIDVQ
jgi:hypothetical protein